MEWNQYLKTVLKEESCLDDILITMNDETYHIPSIVKASVYLLEKMIKRQGKLNVFVFPDGENIPFVFMLSKLIYNAYVGKIRKSYDPQSFVKGQKLKVGNAVVEFVRLEELNGVKRIVIKTSDIDSISMILESAPFFQTTDTKRMLSKNITFRKEIKKIKDDSLNHNNAYLNTLKNMKSHMSDTLFYIGSTVSSNSFSASIRIDDESIYDIFLVGQLDYTGEIKTAKGQLQGIPSIVYSSQIAYVNEAINNGAITQSAIINLSESNIDNQLEDLDELIRHEIPIVCIAGTVDSFGLRELQNRGFNVWRWDSSNITSGICDETNDFINRKINRCRFGKVYYHTDETEDISKAFSLLYSYRKSIDEESVGLNEIYSDLMSIAYSTLRNISFITTSELEEKKEILSNCQSRLEKEKSYIQSNCYTDFKTIIDIYNNVFTDGFSFPKVDLLQNLLREKKYKKIHLICSNNDDIKRVKEEWSNKLARGGYRPQIIVYTAKEFLKEKEIEAEVAVMTGWFGSDIVRKIIYGYHLNEIHILLYGCEKKWQTAHSKRWYRELDDSGNKSIAKKSFSDEKNNQYIEIKTNKTEELDRDDLKAIEEQDDLELIIQENKYKKYVRRGNTGEKSVEAIPVSFVGGDFSLFQKGHKLLVITDIVFQMNNKFILKDVESIAVGDFIVVRESSKDLVREVADKILDVSGKSEARKTALIWKDAIKVELAFSSIDDILNRLIEAGCSRGVPTMRNWIMSEDMIIPNELEDLQYISDVTGDSVLAEKIDDVYSAGRLVKNAHIKAGNILSERLTRSIANKLMAENIDPFNVWDPIELDIEDVGSIKIYKIMDIGKESIVVNASDTNRILSEEREMKLWPE